jgi:hypothetical protein
MRAGKLLTAAVQIDAVPKPNSMPEIPYLPDIRFDTTLPMGPKMIIAT